MWKAEQIYGTTLYCVTDDDGAWVANLKAEHANRIVRAVNSHRELLETLDAIMNAEFGPGYERTGRLPDGCAGTYWGKARAAIERART